MKLRLGSSSEVYAKQNNINYEVMDVAKIEREERLYGYLSIEEALEDAELNNDMTITLLQDIEITNEERKDINLCNKKLVGNKAIVNNGIVTISNGEFEGKIVNNGEVILENIKVVSSTEAVENMKESIINMKKETVLKGKEVAILNNGTLNVETGYYTYTMQDDEYESLITRVIKEIIKVNTYDLKEEKGASYIENIKAGTTIRELKEGIITEGALEIYKGENIVDSDDVELKTGMRIQASLEGRTEEYEIVVIGDITGDGKIDELDLLMLARYKAGFKEEKEIVEGAKLRATDIVKNNELAEDVDLLKLARVLAKLDNI